MTRFAALLIASLLPALAFAESAAATRDDGGKEPGGVMLGVGYGLHRYGRGGRRVPDYAAPRLGDGG